MKYINSIFDLVKSDYDKNKLLEELNNELNDRNSCYTYEDDIINIRNLNNDYKKIKSNPKKSIAGKFSFLLNESTIKAEFYYSCKIKRIPCYLESASSGLGRVDAIIKIKNKHIIIEFKKLKVNETIFNHIPQLKRYKKSGLPVVFVENNFYNDNIINCIKRQNLINEIYYYETTMDVLIPVSY